MASRMFAARRLALLRPLAGRPTARRFATGHAGLLGPAAAEQAAAPLAEFVATGAAWGPVNLAAAALEHLHLATGAPWPVTIALFTLGLRAALFPFTVLQTRSSVNAQNLRPEVDRLRAEGMALQQAGQRDKAKATMLELSRLMKTNGIGVGRLLGLGVLPVPFFMSTFFALRSMTQQPMASLLDGGALWFPDLCAADPYYLLPLLTTATLLGSLEVGPPRRPASHRA